jgi:LysM repeat protein
MSTTRYLLLAATFSLASCSLFKKGGENYDTVDGGVDPAYDTSNPYGVPGEAAPDSVPYQPVNPPADNPTYAPAAYEDSTPPPAGAAAEPGPATAAASTRHTVAKGDTLGAIARRYGSSTAAIKQANGMTSDTVVLGKTLVIPGSSGPVASAPAAGGRTYTVVKGDTLSRIASRNGTTAEAIKKANGMSSDTVVLGTRLRIP